MLSTMKKLLLALPLIAGTSWAGTAYYAGSSTKDAYTDLLLQLNEFKPFTLVNEQYSAGIANSTAITNVMASSSPDAELLFQLHHDINHSPVGLDDSGVRFGAATIKTSLVLSKASSTTASDLFKGFTSPDPLVINTNVKFDGTATHQLLVSAFSSSNDAGNLRFDGMDYTAAINGTTITGEGSMGALSVNSAEMNFKLTPGVIDVDLEKHTNGIYAGSYGISFEKLSIKSAAMPFNVGVQAINFSSDSEITGTNLNSNVYLSVGNIDSPLPIKNIAMEVGTQNISIEGMSDYIKTMSRFSALDETNASNPEFINQWLSSMTKVLGPKAGATYNIDIRNDGGNANVQFALGIIDESSPNYPQLGLASLTTVRDLLDIMQAELHFTADSAALDATPLAGFLMSPKAEQFIVADGATYQSNIKMKDLIVDINGNPLSLELIMGDTLDMPLSAMAEL